MDYLVFCDARQATDALGVLNSWSRQKHGCDWAELIEHPSRHRYAVPFDDRVRPALDLTLIGATLMSDAKASMEGFYLSPLAGRFSRPLHQCGDAELLIDEFVEGYGRLPFPVMRSRFFASLGVLYAVRCHLTEIMTGEVAKSLPGYATLSTWWKERCDDMHRDGELLKFMHGLNNSEKHSRPSVAVALVPVAKYFKQAGLVYVHGSEFMSEARGFRLSAAGVFQATPFAKGYERWRLPDGSISPPDYGIIGAEFTFSIAGLPDRHLGAPILDSSPPAVLLLYLDYHFAVLREAIAQWDAAAQQHGTPAGSIRA